MKQLTLTLITLALLSCTNKDKRNDNMKDQKMDFEILAHEGISVDFQFNSDKPTFGDLFLVVGFENPNSPPNSREFEKLSGLGFEQTDDYFGIKSESDNGDDVKLWLFPIINGQEVYHDNGPFDAVRITYVVVRNTPKIANLYEKVYNAMTKNLDVTPIFNGKTINDYSVMEKTINETIQYCRSALKVEPGSDQALQLEW